MLYDATGKDKPQLSTEDERTIIIFILSDYDNDLKAGTIMKKFEK